MSKSMRIKLGPSLTHPKFFGLRVFLRYFRYFEGLNIKLAQDKLIKCYYPRDVKKLIVFLVPGLDVVNGGLMSISSIYEETKKLEHVHEAETIMCTIPGNPLLLRYTKFPNQNYIFRFDQVLAYFQNLESIIIHNVEIEYYFSQFLRNLTIPDRLRLRKIKNVHFNIMIQNINFLPSINYVVELGKLGKLTCTTAHEQYSTHKLSRRLGCPLHKLSVFVSPEKYIKKTYLEKENLMIVSNDLHPRKTEVLNLIAKRLPKLKIQIIENLTYDEYKKTISRAKWALTFGEGLDGYFVETVFSGGISFSVYNKKFFTEDFGSLRTVYENYDVLTKRISIDIKDLDNELAYTAYQNKQFNLCQKHYAYNEYIKNLEAFYKGEYTIK